MSAARLPAAVRDLLRTAPDAAADADLLTRFAAARDEAAFAGLVRRHGATVWDVCRSVLGNRADADDAFQAVFLTLARRAAALRKPASVGAWLHGVAVRVARKARAAAARRQLREAGAPLRLVVEEPDPDWAEVRAAVHDALAALPGVYREPLVACYLRGLTQDDAAAELGLTKVAVKKRLERGRDRLRAALTRRGVAPAAVLAAGAAPAAVPDHLLDAAPRLAVGAVPVPNTILRLVEGGTSMSFAKVTAALGLFAAVGLAVAAGQERPLRIPGPKPGNPPPVGAKAAKLSTEAETPQTDRAKVAGEWTVKWIETSGEALFDLKNHDETLPPPKFVFSGNRCEVKGVRVLFVRDFTFAIDEFKAPKEIDATFLDGPKKGETFVGIYVLRGDELRVCLRLQGLDHGRPKGFVTNSGTTLYTFILTRPARTAPVVPRGTTAPPPAPPGPAPKFDEVLHSENKLYFVLNRPGPERFEDELAAVGQRLDHAAKTAERVQNMTIVLFKRTDPKGKEGSYTGLSAAQLRALAALPADKRADKLLEHAWTLGRLPKDAIPFPQPRDDRPLPALGPAPAATKDAPLSAAGLAALVTGEGGNPARAYGKVVEFTATVKSVFKGVGERPVPVVTIEGWPEKTNLYGEAYVHNVVPNWTGKAGDRVKVRGLVLEHGYGTLFLWAYRWERLEAAPAPPAEVSIYDRVHRKADLPFPGDEVKHPKDAGVAYYLTNRLRMWGEPKNTGKHAGLYESRDGGKTWRLKNTWFEFQKLFVHPGTGHLFAVIGHSWLGSDEKDGELHRYHADKAITSADGGGKWKDITPPPGYVANILDFCADPDHPGRACLLCNVIRDVIYRPKDDRYAEWDVIRSATTEGQQFLTRAGVPVGR